jgi:hypothetical protein
MDALLAYYYNGLVLDVFAMAPFNIILGSLAIEYPLWATAPARLLRLVSLARIQSIFLKVEFGNLSVARYVTGLKTILFLVYLWHWSSCFWFFLGYKIEGED